MEADQIKSFKEFMTVYNKLSETCFADCIWDFTNRKISKSEENCSLNCADKFMKANQRISTRFQEFQLMANENAMEAMKKATS